jgi:hypothetical protein
VNGPVIRMGCTAQPAFNLTMLSAKKYILTEELKPISVQGSAWKLADE